MTSPATILPAPLKPESASASPGTRPRSKPISTTMSLRWLKAVAGCRELSPAALSLAVLIRERLDRSSGVARFGFEYAETTLGFKHSALSKGIRQLEEAGLIAKVRTDRRRSNEYLILLDRMFREEERIGGEMLQLRARQKLRTIARAERLTDAF